MVLPSTILHTMVEQEIPKWWNRSKRRTFCHASRPKHPFRWTSHRNAKYNCRRLLIIVQRHISQRRIFHFYGKSFWCYDSRLPTGNNFLSLRIYLSEHGISLDQTNHIYTNILAEWFDDNPCVKRHNNPIKAHPTYEYDLAQSPPLQEDELEHYEKKYHSA